jgi:alanine dehydrogenase
VLLISREEVEGLLDLDELEEAIASAMAELSSGNVSMVPRTAVQLPDGESLVAHMGCHVPSLGIVESKLVSVFPGNVKRNMHTHQAIIAVFDPETGTPTALMDAAYITEVRTAAGSALATRLLSRQDSKVLAILGTGVQARSHARAIPRVREISEVVIAGRDPEKARALANKIQDTLDVAARPASTFEEAIGAADIVCACTHSIEPVVHRDWVKPGTHINSVGVNPAGREIDAETIRDALVVVEHKSAAIGAPGAVGANDLSWAIRDGVIGEDHIDIDIGQLVSGDKKGRSSPDQITLYRSVGVAVQDAAAASVVLQGARATGAGTQISL